MNKFLAVSILSVMAISCTHRPSATTSPDHSPTEQQAPTRAHAVLKFASGMKAKGMIHFTAENGEMTVETMVEGIKSGPHGFHIHEVGDCSKADFTSAGGHFHVHSNVHGSTTSKERHAGDLGNLMANSKGVANTIIKISDISFKGESNIIGKSVVIHKDKDDFKSQPAGNSGARIACGVIEAL